MKKYRMIDLILLTITLTLMLLIYLEKSLSNTVLSMYLLIINTYMCIKIRKNKKLCVLFIMLLYFNYSFIISRYIGNPTSIVANLYKYIYYPSTHQKGIFFIILMFTIINLSLKPENEVSDKNTLNLYVIKFKYIKILILAMQIGLICILLYHFINKIPANGTTFFEYAIIIFIFTFMMSKNDKKNKIITEVIMLLYILYSFKDGERIAVLQFLLVDFFINYIEKFKIKQIVILMIIGIFVFTFEGIYGDILVSKASNFSKLNGKYVLNKLSERRFALDTSVSSYYTYLSLIEVTPKFSNNERIKDGIYYNILYPILGAKYHPAIVSKIKIYKPNNGGGFPTGYYYYYFGIFGVFLISIYIAFLLKVCLRKNNIYNNYLFIYILSTMPRWYLYDPNLLIRGLLIFSLIYFIINFLFLRRNRSDYRKEL